MNSIREREKFLEEIRTRPRNTSVRAIFADWLDEHDEPELADFYRSWTLERHEESEKWLWDYIGKIMEEGMTWGEDHCPDLTLEILIQKAHDHLDTGKPSIYLGFDTPEHVSMDRKEFWDHFQTVTGRRIGVKDYSEVFFRCGC